MLRFYGENHDMNSIKLPTYISSYFCVELILIEKYNSSNSFLFTHLKSILDVFSLCRP